MAEETELVIDAIPDRRQIERRERLHETGGQSTKPPVSKAQIGALIHELIKIQSELGNRFPTRFENTEIHEVVLEKTPHEVFQRQIVDPTHILPVVYRMHFAGPLQHPSSHREADRTPPVSCGRGFDAVRLIPNQIRDDFRL